MLFRSNYGSQKEIKFIMKFKPSGILLWVFNLFLAHLIIDSEELRTVLFKMNIEMRDKKEIKNILSKWWISITNNNYWFLFSLWNF